MNPKNLRQEDNLKDFIRQNAKNGKLDNNFMYLDIFRLISV